MNDNCSSIIFCTFFWYIDLEKYMQVYISSFKKIYFIFRQSGREGEREGEKHQRLVASRTPPTGEPGL